MCCFASGFFHVAWRLGSPSKWQRILVSYCFLLLSDGPRREHTTFCFCISWDGFQSGAITHVRAFAWACVFISRGWVPRSSPWLTFKEIARLFDEAAVPFDTPVGGIRGFQFLHVLSVLLWLVFLTIAVLVGCTSHFTVALICVFLMIDDIDHLFTDY